MELKISQVVRLIDRSEFVKAVIEETANAQTYRDAFYRVNDAYESVVGRSRYADYQSFRVAKHREQRKLDNKKQDNQLELF